MTTPSPAALEQRLRKTLVEEYAAEHRSDWVALATQRYRAKCDTDHALPILLRALQRAGLRLEEGEPP